MQTTLTIKQITFKKLLDIKRIAVILCVSIVSSGCVSVPPEATALSEQLGLSLSAIEKAHIKLAHDHFSEKRDRIDQYIDDVWIPSFSQEFFNLPANQALWDDVITSNGSNDRTTFLLTVGPVIQKNINSRRHALMEPLNVLETKVIQRLRSEYVIARFINQSISSYLHTVSEIGENRQRYLDKIGFDELRLNDLLDRTDSAIASLVGRTDRIRDHADDLAVYRDSLKALIEDLSL